MKKKRIPKSEPLKYFSGYEKETHEKTEKEIKDIFNREDIIETNRKYHLFRELAYMNDKYGKDKFRWIKENELDFMKQKNFLKRHRLRPETRTKMIDWMVEVFYKIESAPTAFELAVHIMDNYIIKTENILYDKDILLIGLTCIYLSSKLLDKIPLRITQITDNIGGGIYQIIYIVNKEKEIAETLNYDFFSVGIYDYLTTIFCDLKVGNFKKINELNGKEIIDKYNQFCLVLGKLALYNEEILSYKTSLIYLAILNFGFDMLKLKEKKLTKDLRHFIENWICYVANETDVLSYDVELVYKEILKLYKNYIYQPIERNKLRIRKKIKGYEELINLAKYYQEKLL